VIEERLRSAILDGRLPPGTALRQQELASLFGVSRMPVREACASSKRSRCCKW
jgi:DNA-binding GntR family transcriptional regulator